MAVTYKDWHEMLPYMSIVLQYIFQQGKPPPSLSIRRGGQSPVNRSTAGIPPWLNLKCMTTLYNYIKRGLKRTSNKKVRPRKFQEGNYVPKKVLSSQPNSKGKWTPNHEGSCAMSLTTMDGDKVTHPLNASAIKKYSIEK